MSNWMGWMAAAGLLVVLEIFIGTFYLLIVAIGLLAGALASLAGLEQPAQFLCSAIVGIGGIWMLRRSRLGKSSRLSAAHDPNVNLDIGQTLMVKEWRKEGETYVAQAMYRGAVWTVELRPGATAKPGAFVIREVRSNRLIVANESSH